MATVSHAAGSGNFFHRLPRRSIVVFLFAVFCIFSPVGLLFISSLNPQRPWLPIAIQLLISGSIAVSWAATFVLSRWFVIGIVVTNLAMVAINTVFRETVIGPGSGRPSLDGLGIIAAIVVGYLLFLAFISGQGRTTMRLITEMSLARDIHETLVPPIDFRGDEIEALGFSSASTEMGGDLVDVVERPDGTDAFLADVAGHGVRAGVVMGMVKSALRMGLGRGRGLADLLGDLNDVLEATTSPELYATFAGMRIERGGRVEYALAGHHHIAHVRADGTLARLGGRTFPLGLFGSRRYDIEEVTLAPGDLLVVYTDGLNETADDEDRELGHEPIEQTLTESVGLPLAEIRRTIFDRVERHGPQNDDRSLLLVRYRPA